MSALLSKANGLFIEFVFIVKLKQLRPTRTSYSFEYYKLLLFNVPSLRGSCKKQLSAPQYTLYIHYIKGR